MTNPETPRAPATPWTNLQKVTVVGVIVAIATVTTAIVTIGKNVQTARGWIPHLVTHQWPRTPVVLYTYPVEAVQDDSGFGILRRDGFQAGIGRHEGYGSLTVKTLSAPLENLKAGNISGLDSEITKAFERNDVVAVVAPSITEGTGPVIDLVRKLQPTVPIILESSIALASVSAENVYRLSSGVDMRGEEIAHLILALKEKGRPVAIIAELKDGSYGAQMLHWAVNDSARITTVPTLRFPSGQMAARLNRFAGKGATLATSKDQVVRLLNDPKAVIFFLGLGGDFKQLVDSAYRKNSRLKGKAKLVGIMNAYRLNALYRNEPRGRKLRADLIYELTDLDFAAPMTRTADHQRFIDAYTKGDSLDPGLRDQAYSYDAALMLVAAIDTARSADSYEKGLDRMNAALAKYTSRGVTGDIKLGGVPAGANGRVHAVRPGQNGGSMLRLARYDAGSGRWLVVRPDEL